MEEEGKEPGKMASAWSWMSTEMRMMAKAAIKKLPVLSLTAVIWGSRPYAVIKISILVRSKLSWEIADELTGMEENLRDCMKKFLHNGSADLFRFPIFRPVPRHRRKLRIFHKADLCNQAHGGPARRK